jgi:hypothetical protein
MSVSASLRQPPPASASVATGKVGNVAPNQERISNEALISRDEAGFLPIPDLVVIDWGVVDYYGMPVERIRAIAFLRALSEGR